MDAGGGFEGEGEGGGAEEGGEHAAEAIGNDDSVDAFDMAMGICFVGEASEGGERTAGIEEGNEEDGEEDAPAGGVEGGDEIELEERGRKTRRPGSKAVPLREVKVDAEEPAGENGEDKGAGDLAAMEEIEEKEAKGCDRGGEAEELGGVDDAAGSGIEDVEIL